MLDWLRHERLDVLLVPAKRGSGMIRKVQGRNPQWYVALCERHASTRTRKNKRFDTSIKRQHVEKALWSMANGLPFTYHHDEMMALVRDTMAGEYSGMDAREIG